MNFNGILGVGLILTPLVLRISHFDTLRESKDIFFYLIFGLLVLFSDSPRRIPRNVLICLIILLIQAFFLTNNFAMPGFWYQFQMFLAGTCIFGLIYKNYDKKYEKYILNCICIAGISQTAWCILEFCDLEPYKILLDLMVDGLQVTNRTPGYIAGTLGNRNLSGALIAIAFPAFLRRKWVYLLPVLFFGLYVNKSSLPIITAVSAIAYYGYLKYFNFKMVPWIGLALACIFFVFVGFPENGFFDDSHRGEVWDRALGIISLNWFWGFGLGHFAQYFHKHVIISGYAFKHIHNEFIELLYALGAVGFGSVSYIFYKAIKDTDNKIILSGLFAIAVNSFGNFMFHITPLAFIGISYCAIALRQRRDNVTILER